MSYLSNLPNNLSKNNQINSQLLPQSPDGTNVEPYLSGELLDTTINDNALIAGRDIKIYPASEAILDSNKPIKKKKRKATKSNDSSANSILTDNNKKIFLRFKDNIAQEQIISAKNKRSFNNMRYRKKSKLYQQIPDICKKMQKFIYKVESLRDKASQVEDKQVYEDKANKYLEDIEVYLIYIQNNFYKIYNSVLYDALKGNEYIKSMQIVISIDLKLLKFDCYEILDDETTQYEILEEICKMWHNEDLNIGIQFAIEIGRIHDYDHPEYIDLTRDLEKFKPQMHFSKIPGAKEIKHSLLRFIELTQPFINLIPTEYKNFTSSSISIKDILVACLELEDFDRSSDYLCIISYISNLDSIDNQIASLISSRASPNFLKRLSKIADNILMNLMDVKIKLASLLKVKNLLLEFGIVTDDNWINKEFFEKKKYAFFSLEEKAVELIMRWINDCNIAREKLQDIETPSELAGIEEGAVANLSENINKQDSFKSGLTNLINDLQGDLKNIDVTKIPDTILETLNHMLLNWIYKYSRYDDSHDKNQDLVNMLIAMLQIQKPFLGCYLSVLFNPQISTFKTQINLLEAILESGLSKYNVSFHYLIAQLYSKILTTDKNLDKTQINELLAKAEKYYLKVSSYGIGEANLKLAKTYNYVAHHYTTDYTTAKFLLNKAIKFAKKASEMIKNDFYLDDALISHQNFKYALHFKVREENNEQQPIATIKSKKQQLVVNTSSDETKDFTTAQEIEEKVETVSKTEVIAWRKAYVSKDKMPISLIQAKEEIEEYSFWNGLHKIGKSITINSYDDIKKLADNNFFIRLQAGGKFTNMNLDKTFAIAKIFRYKSYYHFLQAKYYSSGTLDQPLKLFDNTTELRGACSVIKIEQILSEGIKYIAANIKWCFPKAQQKITSDSDIAELIEFFLELPPENYAYGSNFWKVNRGAVISTFSHLLLEIAKTHHKEEYSHYIQELLATKKLYDKADKVNPKRVTTTKQEKYSDYKQIQENLNKKIKFCRA